MKIIALSGRARHGKDTAANHLKECLEAHGKTVLITHYADLLKYICVAFFGWDGAKDEYGRSLLQHIGTDIVRKKHPDFWVDFITNILTLFDNEWDYVIIGDARFPNEISKLREAGFDVTHARITRTDFESPLTEEQQSHSSEMALDAYPVDVWLTNDTLENFKTEIKLFSSYLIHRDSPVVKKDELPHQFTIFDSLDKESV